MKKIKSRTLYSLLSSICFVTSCLGQKIVVFHDKYVTIENGVVPDQLRILNAHLSDAKYLTINGKTYSGVRGVGCCYLLIPELNSILFATEDGAYHTTYHLVNTITKHEMHIDAGRVGLGGGFGGPSGKPEDISAEYVEKVESERITIAKRELYFKAIQVINLKSKSVESTESFRYDKDGHMIHHYIDGKEIH